MVKLHVMNLEGCGDDKVWGQDIITHRKEEIMGGIWSLLLPLLKEGYPVLFTLLREVLEYDLSNKYWD